MRNRWLTKLTVSLLATPLSFGAPVDGAGSTNPDPDLSATADMIPGASAESFDTAPMTEPAPEAEPPADPVPTVIPGPDPVVPVEPEPVVPVVPQPVPVVPVEPEPVVPVVPQPVPVVPVEPEPVVTEVPKPAPAPIPTKPAAPVVPGPRQPTVQPNLRAHTYDGVFAEGVPVGVAMATTRWLESRGDYRAQSPGSTASGAYQVIDSTWNGYGGYARAADAEPEVQDRFAYESFTKILKEHGGDVSKIPLIWYVGSIPSASEMDVVPVVSAGNVLTPREYQAKWMAKFAELLQQGAPPVLPADTDPLIPSIAFPVLGPLTYADGWHHARDGGARKHEGTDLIAERGQPLRAAFDGVVVRLVGESSGISGVSIEIRRNDGDLDREPLSAVYRHVNDDTLGTNDGRGDPAFRIHPDIEVGTQVRAGQIIGYNGNSGKTGYIPHLHFELRIGEERTPFNPYPALLEAEQREQCTIGIGPWSTVFESPATTDARLDRLTVEEAAAMGIDELAKLTDRQLANLEGVTEEQRAALVEYEPPVPFLVEGPDGSRWTIAADGTVRAQGAGALITPNRGGCDVIDGETWFGTDAAGLPLEFLAPQWWGEEEAESTVLASGFGPQLAARLAAQLAASRVSGLPVVVGFGFGAL
jgi:hypothetical protein